jgi:putative peptidoglycan lipid II flippase
MSSVFDRAIASWLAAGGVSALRYGESIVRLPFAAISPAWGQAVYPALVRARNFPGEAGLASMSERIVRYAIAFFVPLSALTVAVAPVAVATAYGRGSFTTDDVMVTAQVVAVSAPLIVMWTVAPTLVAALNARRMGTVMLIAGVINVILNLLLNVLLGYLFGVVGIALATTLATAVVVLYFGHRLGQVEPAFSLGSLYRVLFRASVAILPSALIFGIPIWGGFIQGGLLENVVVLAVAGVAGLWSYYLIARLVELQEVDSIVGFGRSSLAQVVARVRAR